METVINMLTAFAIIVIILINGASRLYFKRKFNAKVHIADVAKAVHRQQLAKQGLHNGHTK